MPPITLTAAVHPILQDRHKALTAALFAIWEELGVEVTITTTDMKALPRGAGARERGPLDRPVDGRLRGSRRLHVRPLPLGGRPHAGVLLVARDGPSRGGGAHREPPRGPRGPLPEVREPSSRLARLHPALSRGGLPDRRSGRARRRASKQPAVRQLSRDREVGGAGGSRPARVGRGRHPRAGRRRRARLRSGIDGDSRAGRDDAARLRDADAGRRGRARRSVARLGGDSRGRRRALPLPPAAGRALSRRPRALRPRRPLLLRAPSPEGDERRPVPPRPDPRSPEPHRRQGLGSRGLPHRLALRSSSSSWRSRCRSSPSSCRGRAPASSRKGPASSERAGGRAASARGRTASRASSPGNGWSWSGTPPTGAKATRRTRASSSGSAFPPRRSAPSSWPAGSPSLRISFRPTPKPCARTRVSARRTARARAS